MSVNQKGSALIEGALTDEVFDSSASITTKTLFGGQKGLQQFYSPEQLAKLARSVIGDRLPVLDPTAGDGMLLSEFPLTQRFGIEIDHDQVKNAKEANRGYNAIKGDLQHVYPLLRKAIPSWDAIVANPPFGLQWEEPTYRDGRPTNSAVLTFIYSMRLLADEGQLIFVCGRDRFYKQIMRLEDATGVYAVIECDDLFQNVALPCVIAFALHPGNRSHEWNGYEKRQAPLDMLDLLGDWVKEQRQRALGNHNDVSTYSYGYHNRVKEFEIIQAEYQRRLEGRTKANREYDALLVGGTVIQWLPSAFARLALSRNNDEHAFNGLNGQPINYFAQNERLWSKILQYADQKVLTVEPKLFDAVEHVIGHMRKERVPLYHVKPTQRLGFLTDVEFLKCIRDDTDLGFHKGESYRLNTKTKTIIEREKRLVESKKTPGEYVEKEFEKQKKALEIRIGHHHFLDGGADASKNIRWLLDHFELPDPGDVETRHPEDIARLEALVRSVMEDFQTKSREWEKKNSGVMPFTIREFQVKDIARLLFKGGGLLSWEQGLGKTLGGLAFYLACVKQGAQDACLIVTANDLIDQWTRECERFLGRRPTMIRTHGQAKRIAHELRLGGTGLYITHYGVMSINGTKGKNLLLPPVTVREWTEPRKVKGTGKYGYFYFAHESNEELPVSKDMVREAGQNRMRAERPDLAKDEYALKNIRYWAKFAREDGYIQVPIPESEFYSWKSKHDPDDTLGYHGYIPERSYQIVKKLTSRDLCPECEADHRNGWNGVYCEATLKNGSKCGYSHYAIKVRPIASLLSTAFRNGVGIYDEIQMMQARAGVVGSKRSKAMRGMNFRHTLGMTGTPIKNYIDQAFWPLWKCLGNASTRFPFDYTSGDIKFESDFAVVEFVRNGGRREGRKALPEVTNLSLLWRLLASSIIRRRKEETNEPLVPKYYHELRVPLGMSQAEQIQVWLKDFPKLFAEKYPEHPIVKAGFHEIRAATLGLNWKLDYACTIPESDPDVNWTGVHGISNYTPANLRVLELAMALAKQGRKVLIGSHMKEYGKWVAERLQEKGVKAVHILDENNNTVDADERADRVYEFQTDDDTQVFCAGTKAIRLGHNLDAANAVILNGLDFDYETLDQFIARIHRLTSKEPVDVFVILPTLQGQETITTRKWALLDMKGGAAELALDGRLILKNEQIVTLDQLVDELRERGLNITDEVVDETSVQETWEAMKSLDEFEPEATVIPPRVDVDRRPPLTLNGIHAAMIVGQFLKNALVEKQIEEQLDIFSTPAVVPDELVLQQNQAELDAEAEKIEAELAEIEASATKVFDSSSNELEAAEAVGGSLAALWPTSPEPEAESSNDPEPPASTTSEETPGTAGLPSVDGGTVLTHAELSGDSQGTQTAPHVEERGGEAKLDSLPEPVSEPKTLPAPFDPMGQLKQAKELHDIGVLDAAEYAAAKAALLAQIGVAA